MLERIDDHLSELTYNRYTEGFAGSPLDVKITRKLKDVWMYSVFVPWIGWGARR